MEKIQMDNSMLTFSHWAIWRFYDIIGYDKHFTDYYTKRYRTGIYDRLMAYYRE